jgi:hypothetical protein
MWRELDHLCGRMHYDVSGKIAVWVAIRTAIGACGRLMDLHVKADTNSKLRSRLIEIFLFIERPPIASRPEIAWRALKRGVEWHGWVGVPLLIVGI